MKNSTLIIVFCFFALYGVKAQQNPQFTQYLYNMSVINPAYTTNDTGLVNFGTMYRSQWVSAVGSPKTLTFFTHAALSDKVEVGLSFISDDNGEGVVKRNSIFADFAYNLQLSEKSAVALGLKAGFLNNTTNFDGFRLPDDDSRFDDPAFRDNLNSIAPNVGLGVFYHMDKFYAGFSIPNLIPTKQLDDVSGVKALGTEAIHMFLTAGYIYELNDNIKLKPSFLLKNVAGAPLSIDGSLNVLINGRFEVGASYRLEDSVNAMFNVSVFNGVRIGYSYDYTLSNLSQFNSGSHELFVLFDLDVLGLKRGYDKSPRFY